MSDYEPPAEMVEALAKELNEGVRPGCWHVASIARFVLRRQHERECGLLEALRAIAAPRTCTAPPCICKCCRAYKALAAHAKLDAPKVLTLLEAAKAMLRYPAHEHCERWLALEAAVEREERGA